MKKDYKEFNQLVTQAINYLLTDLSYSPTTTSKYRRFWKRIKNFMVSEGIMYYNKDTEKKLLQHEFNNREVSELSDKERQLYNGIMILSEFQETGKIKLPFRKSKYPLVFEGAIGVVISEYLDYKNNMERISKARHNYYQRCLHSFLTFCHKNNIYSFTDLKMVNIFHYISNPNFDGKIPPPSLFSTLRGFLNYVFEQELLDSDYSAKLPKCKSISQPQLPSTYSKEEVEKLISSVDRSSTIGKRDYAIILLAARLGLRASDIIRLKFDSLNWITSTITLKQVKTGKDLSLPLLPDVGNAIIDYLKYGRSESEHPYVFLTEKPPYGYIKTSYVVTRAVHEGLKNAGIDIKGRKSGSHSLRHSLAFRMLQQSTILPVISEVLGHANTKSTKYYLRIDLKSMEQCMLDVSPITTDFYEQKGGVFYETTL